jgi:hypothetical protein
MLSALTAFGWRVAGQRRFQFTGGEQDLLLADSAD